MSKPLWRESRYALTCGCVERTRHGPDSQEVWVTLWHEGGAYHVRAHDFGLGQRIDWKVFRRLADARKCATELRRHARWRVRNRSFA